MIDDRCQRCLLATKLCMCAEIPRVDTRTEIVILRHVGERWRTSNSGRIAALALSRSMIVDHGGEVAVPDLRVPGTWLVWPEGAPSRVAPSPPPARLVFLDATWRQARRMRQRIETLRGLPILHLPVDEVPAARLRESPGPGKVSTIEAIAVALRLVEGAAPADALDRIFALLIDRVRSSGRRA